jgi:hypothetical protein
MTLRITGAGVDTGSIFACGEVTPVSPTRFNFVDRPASGESLPSSALVAQTT